MTQQKTPEGLTDTDLDELNAGAIETYELKLGTRIGTEPQPQQAGATEYIILLSQTTVKPEA